MFCSRLLCEWIALVFLCHVVGHTLCFGVTPLGLERMLALFGQSYAKGLVINYGEGGATKWENRGSETFCATPSRQGKTFHAPPFTK